MDKSKRKSKKLKFNKQVVSKIKKGESEDIRELSVYNSDEKW